MKQNEKPEAQLATYRSEACRTIERWREIAENGCSDPFYADGVNMNLVRNHLFYYKRKIREVCEENGFDLPAEAFLPDLPYVDANYFVHPNSAHAKRIMNSPSWRCCNQEKPQPRSVNSVKLCPCCQGIPKKEFVYDTVTSKRKLRLFCPHCGERPGDYSDTFDEMISDWNEWASIDENGDEQ